MITNGHARVFKVPEKLREHWLPVSRQSALRPTHAPLVSGDTFRSFASVFFDETVKQFDTETVKDGSIVFCGTNYVRFFLEHVLPEITSRFILISSNGAGTIDRSYVKYLDNPNIFRWFARNCIIKHPKMKLIPLGVCWFQEKICRDLCCSYLEKLLPTSYFRPKRIHTYINFVTNTHPCRKEVLKHFYSQGFCKFSQIKEFGKYISDLHHSKFVISPRGINIDCYRTWEALIAGSIPVVTSEGIDELYEDLPVIIVDSFLDVDKEYLDQRYNELKLKKFNLNKLRSTYWKDAILKEKKRLLNSLAS